MEDFEQRLSAILNDPAQLQGIFTLAKSLGLGTPPGQTQADPDPPLQEAPAPMIADPQPTQPDSAMGLPKAGETTIFAPRYAKSMAPTCCTSLHILTQSPQSMHLL